MKVRNAFTFILAAMAVVLGPGPAGARQHPVFEVPAARELEVTGFTDRELAGLVDSLEAALVRQRPAPSVDDARQTLWSFARRLQAGRLTPSQEATVLSRLLDIGRSNASYQGPVERSSFMLRALAVGKKAPETSGTDLDGRAFRLSEFRGKVVVLTFSADWCGICRSQYPYYRLMQDLYSNWPFAIVGVDTGVAESVRHLKAKHGLNYRSWWDPPEAGSGRGAIASEWNVLGWPTTYVLDAEGVIRFVDLRDEDLLKGVRQLLHERVDSQAVAASGRHH